MIDWNTFKLKLRACRAQAGYSQSEVANFMGVSSKSIVDWENGFHSPTMEKAQKLAEIYNIPLERMDFTKEGNRALTAEERAVKLARMLPDDEVVAVTEPEEGGATDE